MASTITGTCEYIAPEVLNGSGYSFQVDWWAVGIIMYELLIGKTPFVKETREEVEQRIQTKEAKWPNREKFQVEYTDDFADCVKKLLIKDPT